MKLAEFAGLMGVSKQAVSKACSTKRLDRSVTRDDQGRVVDIDPEIGRQEWLNAKLPQHFNAVVARSRVEAAAQHATTVPAPGLVFGHLDDPAHAFVGAKFPLASFLAGARAALAEAGQEATPEALRAVLESLGAAGWWQAVVGALNAAVDPEVPTEQLAAMWEQEGREAAKGVKP